VELVRLFRKQFQQMEKFLPKPSADIVFSEIRTDDFRGYWVNARQLESKSVILYLHGGGFIAGSPVTTHQDLIARISQAAQARVLAVNYSKAPEHLYPVAVNEIVSAYRYLLTTYPPSRIAIGGDSAGGGLSLSTLLTCRQQGLPLPGALFTLSAFTDFRGTGGSVKTNASRDFIIPAETIGTIAGVYLGGTAPDDPIASPVYADFSGFPPTLLQVGSEEVLLDDSVRVAVGMQSAGVPVLLDVWHKQPHVWQAFARFVPEARCAIEDIGRFTRGHLRDPSIPSVSDRRQ
jgi:epsilon-lactone hydrolase